MALAEVLANALAKPWPRPGQGLDQRPWPKKKENGQASAKAIAKAWAKAFKAVTKAVAKALARPWPRPRFGPKPWPSHGQVMLKALPKALAAWLLLPPPWIHYPSFSLAYLHFRR